MISCKMKVAFIGTEDEGQKIRISSQPLWKLPYMDYGKNKENVDEDIEQNPFFEKYADKIKESCIPGLKAIAQQTRNSIESLPVCFLS